ncbi:MAG: SIR2 family NAD-dependent protein deacylase [Candidatus Promineifilaceae bacterium]
MKNSSQAAIPFELIEKLRSAHHIAVLTGAGISAESGVPTFRDAQTGLWSQYSAEELATPKAFERDPRLVWSWYRWRRGLISKADPNAGHLALVDMESLAPQFTLITQNVDGLHGRAGSSSVIELHGNIMRSKCTVDSELFEADETSQDLPRCPSCGALLRPDVVWFGESVPLAAFNKALRAAQGCNLFLSVGTSSFVQPAASLPLEARNAGAITIEINIQETVITPYFDYSLTGSAALLLPALVGTMR